MNAVSAAATKCVIKVIASNDGCLAGYTDKSDGATANTGTLVGDCKYCLASSHAYNAMSGTATKCVAKTIASNDGCITGYTDKSDGTTANTATLVGDCKYCLSSTHVYNAIQGVATACLLKTAAATATCATGYTDLVGGGSASTTGSLAGDCKYCVSATHAANAKIAAATKCVPKTFGAEGGCLAGYTDKSDGTAANTATLVGDCKYCAPGFTENTTTGKCEASTASSSSILQYGVMFLAVIFATLF